MKNKTQLVGCHSYNVIVSFKFSRTVCQSGRQQQASPAELRQRQAASVPGVVCFLKASTRTHTLGNLHRSQSCTNQSKSKKKRKKRESRAEPGHGDAGRYLKQSSTEPTTSSANSLGSLPVTLPMLQGFRKKREDNCVSLLTLSLSRSLCQLCHVTP